jgi:hypothetical protein
MRFRRVPLLMMTILFVAVSILPVVLAGTVFAADSDEGTLNLVTSPLPINLRATPGTTTTTDLLVKNGSTHVEHLKVTLMKFTAYGETGKPSIQERGSGDYYFDWVKFSANTFEAPPDKWVTIKMTITIPKQTAFGYYYAAAFSRATKPQQAKSGQNTILGSSAVLILLAIDQPGAKRVASVNSFTANKRFYEYLPAQFEIKIHNSGNVHLIPTGNIFITRGKTPVATLKVNSANRNVLPATNRIFTTDWEDGFPAYAKKELGGQVVLDKSDKAVSELKWDLSKLSHLRIGKYTAHLLMAYDNGKSDIPMESTLTFWVIPWRLIIAAIAVPTIPAILVYLWSRWLFKRRLSKIDGAASTQNKKPPKKHT